MGNRASSLPIRGGPVADGVLRRQQRWHADPRVRAEAVAGGAEAVAGAVALGLGATIMACADPPFNPVVPSSPRGRYRQPWNVLRSELQAFINATQHS